MTGRPDQLRACSAIQVSWQDQLVDVRLAERCERLTIADTPASFAACANVTLASTTPGATG